MRHNIGRYGSSPDKDRCQAVVDCPPLKEKLHIQQFLGWFELAEAYLPAEHGLAAKILGAYTKRLGRNSHLMVSVRPALKDVKL